VNINEESPPKQAGKTRRNEDGFHQRASRALPRLFLEGEIKPGFPSILKITGDGPMRKWSAFFMAALFLTQCGRKPAAVDFLHESRKAKNERMDWWRGAKFGMFIHWGVYSVPAGEYRGRVVDGASEWIMNTGPIPVSEYEGYAARFNPVKFDADAWAKLAADAGMKYLVITSKHHDGFCMWDSKVTDYDIMDRTPFKRDVMKELSDACRRHGVRFCMYHSIMDWHHPDAQGGLYPNYNSSRASNPNFRRYVDSTLKPQLVELVKSYHPNVLWFDGQWIPDWKLEDGTALYEFVRGLRPSILVNNRVGKGGTGLTGKAEEKVGDFGTPEQEIPAEGLPGVDWESCMTMNDSWGFKEADRHWKSDTTLIWNLVETACKGGNFLLNVGPNSEGVIPAASVERLLAMGDWLKVNGEAVYNTAVYRTPEEGGNLRYTRSRDGKTVYAIRLGWPGSELRLSSVPVPAGSKITLLGSSVPLAWTQENGAVRIELPEALGRKLPCRIAYVFKMPTLPYAERPVISVRGDRVSMNAPIGVSLAASTAGAEIRYTLDGSDPDQTSPSAEGPLSLPASCTLKARAFRKDLAPSSLSEASFVVLDSLRNGMSYALYEGDWKALPDFSGLKPVRSGEGIWSFDPMRIRMRDDGYGIVFRGSLAIPADGEYSFFLRSDDGSRLSIDGRRVVISDGIHAPLEAKGEARLKAGRHPFTVEYFEAGGGESCDIQVEGPGIARQALPPQWIVK
jgi:alpha-L-fucosidase